VKYLITVKKPGDDTPLTIHDVLPSVVVEAGNRDEALHKVPIQVSQMYRSGERFNAHAFAVCTPDMIAIAEHDSEVFSKVRIYSKKTRTITFEGDGYTFTLQDDTITITQPLPDGGVNDVGQFYWDGKRMVDEEGHPILLATTAQDDAETHFMVETAMVPVDKVRPFLDSLADDIILKHPTAAEAVHAAVDATLEKYDLRRFVKNIP